MPNGQCQEKGKVETGLKALKTGEYENRVATTMAREEQLSTTVFHTVTWYQPNQVAPLEKLQVPDFFSGSRKSKTPELYVKYRDYMVGLYRECPRKYLTFTTIRRCLAGDVNGLMKIYRFLERYGLINYNNNPLYSETLHGLPEHSHEVFSRVNGQLDYN